MDLDKVQTAKLVSTSSKETLMIYHKAHLTHDTLQCILTSR